jgi:hypothetical protein
MMTNANEHIDDAEFEISPLLDQVTKQMQTSQGHRRAGLWTGGTSSTGDVEKWHNGTAWTLVLRGLGFRCVGILTGWNNADPY